MTDHPEQDPRAAAWQPKPGNTGVSGATGSIRSDIARSEWRDGQIVSSQTSKTAIGTPSLTIQEVNVAQGVPYERAEDPVYRNPVAPHHVKDDTILYFAGRGQVTALQARQLGWLAPAARPFAETLGSQATQSPATAQNELQIQQQQPQEEEHPDLKAEAFDPAVEQTLTNLVTNTGGLEQFTAIQEIVNSGEISERTLNTLATQLAIEPSALKEQFGPVMAAYKAQGRAALSTGGLNPDDVIAWAQTNKRDALNRAMQQHATQRNTKGYSDLVSSYLAGLADHKPSDALNADLGPGITQRQDAKGRVIVRLPDGSEMLWRTAIQAFGRR